MHYGDPCAMCGLEVAKSKVVDLGVSIDHEEVQMLKKMSRGGFKDTVDIKVMVRDGETRLQIIRVF